MNQRIIPNRNLCALCASAAFFRRSLCALCVSYGVLTRSYAPCTLCTRRRRGGETGRRSGLKIRGGPTPRVGSIPAPGTIRRFALSVPGTTSGTSVLHATRFGPNRNLRMFAHPRAPNDSRVHYAFCNAVPQQSGLRWLARPEETHSALAASAPRSG
jgi:hypothetical protein